MNIIHVSTATTWRGGEQQIAYLYEELRKKGHKQVIICAKGSAMERYCINEAWQYTSATKSGSFNFGIANLIVKTARYIKADIVHVHDSHAHNNAILAVQLFGLNKPIVLSRRVDFKVGGNVFSRWKYNHKAIKKIICVSLAVKTIMDTVINEPVKLCVVHDGIDTSMVPLKRAKLRRGYRIANDVMIIGNLAALAPHKDHMTFLRTVATLKNKVNALYFLIGTGELKQDLEAELRFMGLGLDVILTGFREDAKELLAEFDVLLVTSETEGLGSTILDAFLFGVPVVATAAGGIPEIVLNGETGLLAPVKDEAMLAQHIETILTDHELRQKLVAGAYQMALKHDKSIMAKETLAIYEQILVKA